MSAPNSKKMAKRQKRQHTKVTRLTEIANPRPIHNEIVARPMDALDFTKTTTKGLPYGTRLYYKKRGKGVIIVEQKPMTRHILCYCLRNNMWDSHIFHISLPYVVYIMPFVSVFGIVKFCSEVNIGFRNSPLEEIYDFVGFPPLPNVYGNYRVCLSSTHRWSTLNFKIAKMCDKVIRKVWSTSFTGDNGGWWPDQNARTFSSWTHETNKNPHMAMKFNWLTNIDTKQINKFPNMPLLATLLPPPKD